MKNINTTKNLVLFYLVIGSSQVLSQHSHDNPNNTPSIIEFEAPHGGELRASGKYQIEMVVFPFNKTGKVKFYIYKSDLKTVSIEGITGSATFEFQDGTKFKEELIMNRANEFSAESDKLDPFHCTATFSIKKKTISTSFHYEGHKYK